MFNIIFVCCMFSSIVFIVSANLNNTGNLGIQLFVSIVLGFALFTLLILLGRLGRMVGKWN